MSCPHCEQIAEHLNNDTLEGQVIEHLARALALITLVLPYNLIEKLAEHDGLPTDDAIFNRTANLLSSAIHYLTEDTSKEAVN